jgi:hypothetical protein
VSCAFLLLLWIASNLWSIEYRWTLRVSRYGWSKQEPSRSVDDIYGVFVSCGIAGYWADIEPSIYLSGEAATQSSYWRPGELRDIAASPWKLTFQPGLPTQWWPGVLRSGNNRGTWDDYVWIPLWIPLVMAGVLTALLWWRARPARPGHCRCGYDLTGNVSGRCPECGIELTPPDAA